MLVSQVQLAYFLALPYYSHRNQLSLVLIVLLLPQHRSRPCSVVLQATLPLDRYLAQPKLDSLDQINLHRSVVELHRCLVQDHIQLLAQNTRVLSLARGSNLLLQEGSSLSLARDSNLLLVEANSLSSVEGSTLSLEEVSSLHLVDSKLLPEGDHKLPLKADNFRVLVKDRSFLW